jgi:HupE / UreJ protein
VNRAWRLWQCAALLLGGWCGTAALAHQSGNSYLAIGDASGELSVQLDLSLKDLNGILQRPAGAAAPATTSELAAIQPPLTQFVQRQLLLSADDAAVTLRFVAQSVQLRNDGMYLRQTYAAPALPAAARSLVVRYDFFNRDATLARAFARLNLQGGEASAVFDARSPVQRFALADASRLHTAWLFARQGAMHIWSGPDHLLFLLCVLLPGLGLMPAASSAGARRYRPALWFALQVVTAFTVAHSLTLAAAALGWVELPDPWVEAAIAVSIGTCALLNLWWRGHRFHWPLAFGFGLIHGLGFASGLRELGLMQQYFLEALLAFNLGVEIGQLLVLAGVCALLWPWRRHEWLRSRAIVWGSLAALPASAIWLAQRLLA